MTKFEKEVETKVGTVAGKKGNITYLTAAQRNVARQRMQAAVLEYKREHGHAVMTVKTAEVIVQKALEDFAKEELKKDLPWWELTDYDDIFDYLFFGNHGLLDAIDHFAAELSLPVGKAE